MISRIKTINQNPKGFTLLELLIVISIIAILSVALIFVLNPAETLKKSRDAQRISDLATLKSALGVYTTSTTTPYLGGVSSNTTCKTGTGGGTYGASSKVYYSVSTANTITDTAFDMGSGSTPSAGQVSVTANTLTDGTGWIPVNFDSLIGGSPISNLPIDPINTVTVASTTGILATASVSPDYVYRYACNGDSLTYEIDAILESSTYTTGAGNKMTTDGGNSNNYYEVGTNLKILGMGTNNFDY